MSKTQLRDGNAGDVADLAVLDNIASHGMSLWFWQGAVKMGKMDDAYEWGRSRLLGRAGEFHYRNSRLAVNGCETLGASISYVLEMPDNVDVKKEPEPMRPVTELFVIANNDWFLDMLAVYQSSRGLGVGKLLLDDFLQRGRARGAAHASLVAEDSNSSALALYESAGFSIRENRPYVPFNQTSKSQNWLLLSASLH